MKETSYSHLPLLLINLFAVVQPEMLSAVKLPIIVSVLIRVRGYSLVLLVTIKCTISKTMEDLCFLCNKSDSEFESLVEVVRGIKILRTASIERNDGHIDNLKSVTSVKVHEKCRSFYISKNCIQAEKRRLEQEETTTSPILPCKRRKGFDFKKQCLFCGEVADEVTKKKRKEKYRRKIKNVCTHEFKDTVIRKRKNVVMILEKW